MAICAAAMLAIAMGTKYGLTFSMPFSSPRLCCSSMVGRPPMPLDTMTPMFSASASQSMPLSWIASAAAPSASRVKRAILRASFLSTTVSGSKPLTSPASLHLNSLASNWVMGPMPHLPARAAAQLSAVLFPRGFTVPRPVMTTLRFSIEKAPFYIAMPPSTQSTCPVR